TNILINALLQVMAGHFNIRPSLKKFLKSKEGWINFKVGLRTINNSVEAGVIFHDGKVSVCKNISSDIDTILVFKDDSVVWDMIKLPPNEILNLLLKSKLYTKGNLTYLSLFNFYLSLLLGKQHDNFLKEVKKSEIIVQNEIVNNIENRKKACIKGEKVDEGVKYLIDPYLSEYNIYDFPRIKKFLDIHLQTKPEICHERPKLITDWCRENGFELTNDGKPWIPELRQSHSFNYLMTNKKPLIRKNDLIAGTSTTKEIGVIIYPDAHGSMIWGELNTASERQLNPYFISDETKEILHHEIFPYWADRNFRELVRKKYNNPLSQQLDERFAVYFIWKTAAISHTIPDFPKILKLGNKGIIEEIKSFLNNTPQDEIGKRAFYEAMILCLEGLNIYAKNLSIQAKKESISEQDPIRKLELSHISEICERVPENPASTLDEAVHAIWISWIGFHMENTNAGLSLGRLDQWLQPYFEHDMAKLKPGIERKLYIKHAIELISCFFMRCTDHLPLIPDIGNYLFGGSSSDQAITLGGITPDGKDAVNDMTYIFLKVTEMLSIRDPNVNARYNKDKNSDVYLKRLCGVNYLTCATPSMHNDNAVMGSLEEFNYEPKALKDWSATGCVEPTLTGKHFGHTGCIMMNMVAALEMALNNGKHPLMNWEVGPKTGIISENHFERFDDFFEAFATQYKFLIDNSIEYNNMLGEAHQVIRPTPFLSALISDCIPKGIDVTKGGAKYNTTGVACVGLADVTDSLMVIKTLVFDEKKISFKDLKEAIDSNFAKHPKIHAMVTKKVPLFGSGNDQALQIANRITKLSKNIYNSHLNYRGGMYMTGFWSMSNHVAFGTLAGALPSGRLSGKAFTPGLTPEANASMNLLDNIRDVASLDSKNLNNNIAFNVKVVPSLSDSHEKIIDSMFSYVKTYFLLGGMQMQMNVVTSAMLKDAMLHPENYRNLIVRISGYNAYFVTLNRDMQLELIERAEYRI
ncbi:MAG: formate acetyltransferase, partial [Desulfobacterales bacterium]|nr:formate acetyltransferase [Desulfobacterales bacterium]